jgi:hypothetical protein
MPQAALKVDNSLRLLRTVRIALLVAIILYISMAEVFLRPPAHPLDHTFYGGIAIVAALCSAIAWLARKRMLPPALGTLRTAPNDAPSCARWRTWTIVSDALALSVVLFGFTLRFMGATTAQAAPFYVVGFVLMILWWPRRP